MSERVKLTLAFGVFFVFVAVQIALLLLSDAQADGEFVGMLLLGLGFVVASLSVLPRVWRRELKSPKPAAKSGLATTLQPENDDVAGGGGAASQRAERGNRSSLFMYAGVALCLILWSAAPCVMLADGMSWNAMIGGTRRALPLWALAALLWGSTSLAIGAFAWGKLVRRR